MRHAIIEFVHQIALLPAAGTAPRLAPAFGATLWPQLQPFSLELLQALRDLCGLPPLDACRALQATFAFLYRCGFLEAALFHGYWQCKK